MPNALPLLLIGGAALLMMGGKKTKPKPKAIEPEEKPATKPGEKPEPEPTPEPTPDPGPIGEGEPVLPEGPRVPDGPSAAGSCVTTIYNRVPEYLDPNVADRLNQGALTAYNEAGYYFYIRREYQDEIFDMALTTLASMAAEQTMPTIRSVILREILQGINKECNWNQTTDKFDDPMRLVWKDGMRLMVLAGMMAGHIDPDPDYLFKTGKRYTMPRTPLGLPDKGLATPKIDQRVEILATDKSLQNAEHLIGRVSKLSGPNGEQDRFEIKIVGTFQGKYVRPRLTTKHGFKFASETQSSNAFFSKNAPTGIYRFYEEGVT